MLRAVRLCYYSLCARRGATPPTRPAAESRTLINSVLRAMLKKGSVQKYLTRRMGNDLPVIVSLLVSVLMVLLALFKASLG